MPRTVVLEDDGYFILASWFNGIAHPPGYPLYTLTGYLATHLPVGSIAFRVHMLSAFYGALACLCLWYIGQYLMKNRLYAAIIALAFGISGTFWSQSIIADVYSLNVLFVFLLLLLCLKISEARGKPGTIRLLWLSGFIYGLALSTHWPLLLLSTPMLLVLLWPCLRRMPRALPGTLLCLLAGLLPYVWMVLRSQMNPEFSFYGPINTFQEFWFYVSREGYADIDKSPDSDWRDKLMFCGFALQETARQFGPFGAVFVVIGFVRQWRCWPLITGTGLTLGYLGNTLLLAGLLGFDYDVFHRNIFRVYPLAAYGVCALWLGLGLYESANWITGKSRFHQVKRVVVPGLVLLVLASGLIINAAANYRAGENWAEKYAWVILDSLERDAILFVYTDADTGPIGYVNRILKFRPDIELYSVKGIGFSNRLYKPLELDLEQIKKRVNGFIRASGRPVYYTYGLQHDFGIENYGLVKKVLKDKQPDFNRVDLSDAVHRQYVYEIINRSLRENSWNAMHRTLILAGYCRASAGILVHTGYEKADRTNLEDWVDLVCDSFQGRMERIKVLMQAEPVRWARINELLTEAENLTDQILLKSEYASLGYYRNRAGNKHAGE